jgi:aminoglycoside phosphotransferase (APT) family kinase protein
MQISQASRRYLAKAIGVATREVRIIPLRGANSSLVFRVESASDAGAPRRVLRLFHDEQWLREEPDLAAHEADALTEAEETSLCTPRLIAWENGPDIMGVPFVLMSLLGGEVELKPRDFTGWLDTLAQHLAQLHTHRAPDFAWHYNSWLDWDNLRPPAWTKNPQLWERAIEIARQAPPDEEIVFIHRDFHPVNVLWSGEQISGVVDWVNACQGPAGVDVAHCRTNLAVLFGIEAADTFLKCYESRAGEMKNQAYWDACSVLDVVLPAPQWYRPWSEFGLHGMAVEEMQQRDEDYLNSVMR